MPNETPVTSPPDGPPIASKRGGLMRPIGSLRDALIAAGRDDRRMTQIVDRSTTDPRGSTARLAAGTGIRYSARADRRAAAAAGRPAHRGAPDAGRSRCHHRRKS